MELVRMLFVHVVELSVATQIIATSHDLTLDGGLVREVPGYFRGNLGGENLSTWPDNLHGKS